MTDGENASTLHHSTLQRFRSVIALSLLSRILAITSNTLTELTRLKVFYVLLVFGLLLIGSSIFMAQFSFQQEFQILKGCLVGRDLNVHFAIGDRRHGANAAAGHR